MAEPWLEIDGLGFGYGRERLFDGLSAAVLDGEPVLAVVGPSGVGKSTLLALLAGHLRPGRGELRLDGRAISGPAADRPVVFQDYVLFPWKTVLGNVTFGLKCAGVPAAERGRRGRELLGQLGLEGVEGRLPAELSGGMQQRVGLARALAVSPRCVLMDEPFSALDTRMTESLCLETSRLAARVTRFVVVTHDLVDAAFLGSRILVLRGAGDAESIAAAEPPHPRPLGFRYSTELLRRVEVLDRALAGRVSARAAPSRPRGGPGGRR